MDIALLESQLDSFDLAVRQQALQQLLQAAQAGQIALPALSQQFNLHSHTFYSYNAYGYSPSKFAWLARKQGLFAAGIVDFDVLDGLAEFLAAGRLLGLKTVVCVESRVFVPEFEKRVINSPGEPGIAYHMGVGFTQPVQHPYLEQMRRSAATRTRELLGRVNSYMSPLELDFERDVVPLTPNGNVTERHLCAAYAAKGNAGLWHQKLGDAPTDPAKLQNLIRAKTMKKGGVGYVQPGRGSFPVMADMNRFSLDCGAIPALAWLDGTSDGEQCLAELLEVSASSGTAALAIIPDRNFTPGIKDQKLQNLYDAVAAAENRGWPIFIGTEMNSPGNKFVDNFGAAELEPLLPVFRKGAHIGYAHSVLQRQAGLGYTSAWAKETFPSVAAKNEFYEELGQQLQPATEDNLQGLTGSVTPAAVLAKAR